MTTVHITIDDVEHATADNEQEAAALLRLAGRDPKAYDLFVVDKHGVETHIKDKQIVDLHDGERFRSRHKVHFSIDSVQYTSWDDEQTAAELLQRASVDPNRYDLARVGAAGVPEKYAGEQMVSLHDGDEFVTARRAGPVQ